jgi:hypothetical protein
MANSLHSCMRYFRNRCRLTYNLLLGNNTFLQCWFRKFSDRWNGYCLNTTAISNVCLNVFLLRAGLKKFVSDIISSDSALFAPFMTLPEDSLGRQRQDRYRCYKVILKCYHFNIKYFLLRASISTVELDSRTVCNLIVDQLLTRVARYFLAQYTKTVENIPKHHKLYQMAIEYI